MLATTIYLIRHAETTWNAERRVQGTLDAPLSERGTQQVRSLVDALVTVPFSALYSSPLQRALETAGPVAAAHRLELRIEDALREIDQGEWESRLLDEVKAQDGDRLQAWWDSPETVQMPGGENLSEVQRRAMRGLLGIAAQHAGQTVAAVAHGGVNKTILLAALGAPLSSYWRIRQNNACLNILEVDGERARVVTLNETAHLRDDTWHPMA